MFSKVAPQNIMFDRRVVRGNTFAALVIPVNMQPDPMVMQQQQRIKENKRRRQMEMIRNQQIEE
jgi:radial spoke head protein 3